MDGVGGFLKSGLHTNDERFRHFPLRRIQPVLQRFLMVFRLNFDRLQQHRQNIEKFSSDSVDINREFVYALRSVEQLVITMKQLKQTRFQVELDDLPALDLQLMEILNEAVLLTAQFLVILSEDKHKEELSASRDLDPLSSTDMIALEKIMHCSICTDSFEDPRGLPCMHTFCLKCLQQYTKSKPPGRLILCPMCRADFAIPAGGIEAIPKNFLMGELLMINQDTVKHVSSEQSTKPKTMEEDETVAERSFSEDEDVKALEVKLRVFNDCIQELYLLIQAQGSGLSSVSAASIEPVEQQQSSLSLSNFKLLLLPVAGAMIGGAVGGPVGLVAGLKVGKVAAVGGGLLGLTGGTYLKRKKTSERSMSVDTKSDGSVQLSQARSTSSPSISSCQQSIDETMR